MTANLLATVAAKLPAGVLPPVSPDGTGLPGSKAIHQLMVWAMFLAISACGLGAIGSGAAIGIGNLTHRAHLIERGKSGLICAVLGAVVTASAIALVNGAFDMSK